ncbi:MAG: DUF4445 domain-containing protein [Clostridia bacterium]|nr:DUF4445 domain-containing protein [Clostridia bacterium]
MIFNNQAVITVNGKKVSAEKGVYLSKILKGEMGCGGKGKCGKCKVIAKGNLSGYSESEKSLLSKEELSQNIRLACCTIVEGGCEVFTLSETEGEHTQIITDGVMPEFSVKPAFSRYGVAVDIGTTTLAAKLYSEKGELLASVSSLNPQYEWGADVISRIEAALNGEDRRKLSLAIKKAIDGILSDLALSAGISSQEIDGIVITGNTVMLYLLVEESTEPLSHAPFIVKKLFGETVTADFLELTRVKADTRVYIPPCISAFIGADTVCAMLSTEMCNGTDTCMLVDIGTNGEMALWHNGELNVCSTAAGPAFEGVGISMGMRGAKGAIDKVSVEEKEIKCHIIGGECPKGICGSGLVDAIAAMLETEILDETGFLECDEYTLQEPVKLTQKDIRAVQLAKSAIYAGLYTLLKSSEITANTVDNLYIAGGFGNYLNIGNAEKIGLIPGGFAEKARVMGNAALSGAVMLLLNTDYIDRCNLLAKKAGVIELSSNPVFSEQYMLGMILGRQI